MIASKRTIRVEKNYKPFFIVLFYLGFIVPMNAQQDEELTHQQPIHTEAFKHIRLGAAVSHTYIGTTTKDGNQTIIVPSVGVDLEYWLNKKFGLGFHNDLEIESFIIEENHEEVIEKEYPVLLTFDLLWHPWKGLVLLAGYGVEFEKSENLQVARFGLEYEIEFGHHWDVFPTVFYDNHINDEHNTFSVGLGVGKRF